MQPSDRACRHCYACRATKFHSSPKLESGVLGKGVLQIRNQPNTSEDNGVKGAKLEWEFAFRVSTVPFPDCRRVRLGNLNRATQLLFTSDSGILLCGNVLSADLANTLWVKDLAAQAQRPRKTGQIRRDLHRPAFSSLR